MGLLSSADWRIAQAIAGIGHANPFLPERVDLERRALGAQYKDFGPIIVLRPGEPVADAFGNVPALRARAEGLLAEARRRLVEGHHATRDELLVYEDLALYVMYARYMSFLDGLVIKSLARRDWNARVRFWDDFLRDFEELLKPPGRELPSRHDPAVIFALLFQIERAFTHIFGRIIGGSMAAARLRAAVWQSIFTSNMRRYVRSFHKTMVDLPTLIVGPSGSGKELVARAIGLSCYVPFDAATGRFKAGEVETYVPLNLSALAPTLIESELFGHAKGAFTGATKDRRGWLELCGEHGAVFLDEIGELDPAIQVKLLRVLESRRFEKVGGTDPIGFQGKIIAATNRNLAAEMRAGRFRADFYYRLCADQITTPSLAEQLADRPEDLEGLVRFVAHEALAKKSDGRPEVDFEPPDQDAFAAEAEQLTEEVVNWIDRHLGREYAWPGNFRELGQCVRNIMIRGTYSPPSLRDGGTATRGPLEELLGQVREAGLTADALLGRYYAIAYERSGRDYKAAGERLGVDWRTVKTRMDHDFLEKITRPTTATS
jgi:DNA-binding NtrC family response regulator